MAAARGGGFGRVSALWDHWVMRWFRLGPEDGGGPGEPASGEEFSEDIERLGRLAKHEWRTLSVGVFFLLIAAGLRTLIPQAVAKTLVVALRPPVEGAGPSAALWASAKRLGLLATGYGLMSGMRGLTMSVAENRLLLRLRRETFARMLQQDIKFHDERDVGELTSRLNSDCEAVASGLSLNFNVFLRNGVQLVFGVSYLTWTSWRLSLVLVGVWGLLFYIYGVYGRFARRASRMRQDRLAGLNTVATEALTNVRTLRSLASEGAMLDKYEDKSSSLMFLENQRAAAYGLYAAFYNGLTEGIKAVALTAGGALVASGGINPEQLTASMLYVDSVVGSSLAVGGQYRQLMQAIGSSRKVFDYSEMEPSASVVVPPGKELAHIPPDKLHCEVKFHNVTFTYPTRPEDPVLKGLDLTIQAGKTTALVGSSGSGKSTIAALLQRWYEPAGGEVLLDGVPLTDLDPAFLRSLLGVVTQDPRLFSATVRENIALGLLLGGDAIGETLRGDGDDESDGAAAATDEALADEVDRLVREAAAAARASEFIEALPHGYDTMVGDVRLSGGQRQRIALARALARRPRILILDEATSALDRETEAAVQASISEYLKKNDATCLVIAHRLSTVVTADEIIVLDSGRVAERGTHNQLLRKSGGLYKRLVRGSVF